MNEIEGNEEETTEVVESGDDRPLSSTEDIELDIRESIEEVKGAKEEEQDLEAEPAQSTNPIKEKQQKQSQDNNIAPPASWKADAKEWFLKQPVEVKRELSRRASDLDKELARVGHEKVRFQREYADIEETCRAFAPEWGKHGLSRSEAIKALANADLRLRYDLENSLEELARNAGTTLEDIVAKRLGGQPAGYIDPVQNTTLMNLQKKIELLEGERQREVYAREEHLRNQGLSEFENFRNERDNQGKFLRPELHDDNFAPLFEPVVRGIKAAFPGATPRDILNKAYIAVTGKSISNPRVPTVNNQHIQNAKRATLSVPGSRASQAPINRKVPDSVEDTAMEVARELGYL